MDNVQGVNGHSNVYHGLVGQSRQCPGTLWKKSSPWTKSSESSWTMSSLDFVHGHLQTGQCPGTKSGESMD